MRRCRSSWRSSSAAWWPSSCTTTNSRASSRASICSIGCAAGSESARGDDRMSDETPAQRFATRVIHGGQRPDPLTGAVMPPIYATSTYVQSSPGVHQGYDYSRTRNPTRDALQAALASLEGGAAGFAFASGMAAIATVLELLDAGSHIVAMHDLYGGSYRLLEDVRKRSAGHRVSFVDLSNPTALAGAIRPDTRLVWVESPTNPLLKLVDLRDRKSTRLNSSHGYISYAVFCLKKKKNKIIRIVRPVHRPMALSRCHTMYKLVHNIVRRAVFPTPAIAADWCAVGCGRVAGQVVV